LFKFPKHPDPGIGEFGKDPDGKNFLAGQRNVRKHPLLISIPKVQRSASVKT
jgi:hypothetical protein